MIYKQQIRQHEIEGFVSLLLMAIGSTSSMISIVLCVLRYFSRFRTAKLELSSLHSSVQSEGQDIELLHIPEIGNHGLVSAPQSKTADEDQNSINARIYHNSLYPIEDTFDHSIFSCELWKLNCVIITEEPCYWILTQVNHNTSNPRILSFRRSTSLWKNWSSFGDFSESCTDDMMLGVKQKYPQWQIKCIIKLLNYSYSVIHINEIH